MTIIYEPKGRAREYAPLAVNHYIGCTHGCQYCYVPTLPQYKFQADPRAVFHSSPTARKDVVAQLCREVTKNPGDGTRRVLLSFTTDPYQQVDAELRVTRQVIQVLHEGGYFVQVLTKGGLRSLADLDLFTSRDACAATLTLVSDSASREWEPQAALPSERLYALSAFHLRGIPTWASLEPVLNPEAALELIRQTHTFVDLYKVGKLNHHPLEKRIDWQRFAVDAVELLESVGAAYYVKDDLRAYLPAGFERGAHERTAREIESF